MKYLIPALALLLSAPLLAQSPQQDPAAMFLKTFDANGDGKVSKNEFVQPQVQQIEKQFDYMDKNKDGAVDAAEAKAFGEEMQKRMEQMQRMQPPRR